LEYEYFVTKLDSKGEGLGGRLVGLSEHLLQSIVGGVESVQVSLSQPLRKLIYCYFFFVIVFFFVFMIEMPIVINGCQIGFK